MDEIDKKEQGKKRNENRKKSSLPFSLMFHVSPRSLNNKA
jgi:hypothetical protein